MLNVMLNVECSQLFRIIHNLTFSISNSAFSILIFPSSPFSPSHLFFPIGYPEIQESIL